MWSGSSTTSERSNGERSSGVNPSALLVCGLLLCCALLVCGASAASTDVHVAKLTSDGTTVLAERTVDYRWLEANLPVKGDGSTHYYHQGPTFDDADLWDPTESKNVEDKDMGAVKGTALRDLCGLVGGMSSGDTLVVKAADGFSKRFSYGSVYSPSSRQGQMVLTWYKAGEGYVPSYSTGMRIVFFADTSVNPWGWHVFGNADMKASMPSSEWHYFNRVYPTTTGLSIQGVSELRILSAQPAATKPTTTAATSAKTTPATTQSTGGATTKATTGATATPTTARGATTAVPLGTASPSGTTVAPTGDGSPADGTTTVPPMTKGVQSAPMTVSPEPSGNQTGNVTPPAESPVTTATVSVPTYDSSVIEPATDIDEASIETATPTPTVTASATTSPTESVERRPTVAAERSPTALPARSPAPTTSPGGPPGTRSLKFTFISIELSEGGDSSAVIASPERSAAFISPASPLGAIWAFLKAVARMIDPLFT